MNVGEERKSWRPEGWEKIRATYARRDLGNLALGQPVNFFESGADAMLAALIKEGQHFNSAGIKGWLVFIPEEES